MAKAKGEAKAPPVINPNQHKYETFCLEYAAKKNGTQAAIKAGYSAASAAVIAYRLLRKPYIQKRIEELTQGAYLKLKLSGEEVLARLREIGDFDPTVLFNSTTGAVLPIHKWPEHAAKCVAGIKVKHLYNRQGEKYGEILDLKFWNKDHALELLGKNQKQFTDVVESKTEGKVLHVVANPEQVESLVKKFNSDF